MPNPSDALPPLERTRQLVETSPLFRPGSVTLARAPGRLDVMGGIADYSGSEVLELPLAVAAVAAVQRRGDRRVACASAQAPERVVLPLEVLATDDPERVREAIPAASSWARYGVGCLWHALRRSPEPTGLTLLLDSDVPLGAGVSSSAAIEVATLTAARRVLGLPTDPVEIATAGQEVENRVVGAPCGIMDQMTSALGKAGRLLRLECQPDSAGHPARVLGFEAIPSGVALVGLHSGVRHEVSGDPYTDTRVASFMGEKILSASGHRDPTAGWLANVGARRFRNGLRALLPESMSGREFLDRHGGTRDAVTRVDPDRTYRVRAAAEHHVLEPERVAAFAAALARARRPESSVLERERALVRAGRCMLASHWSYGLRAGLGHRATDWIARAVRSLGPGAGFYGARVTGGGCGGTVAILLAEGDAPRERLESLRERYERDTGRRTALFAGSGPGADRVGPLELERRSRA